MNYNARLATPVWSLNERVRKHAPMLSDGIYRIEYRSSLATEGPADCALAVLRDGEILGSDKHGGLYLGTYEREPATGRERIFLRLEIPPAGVLVTGKTGGTSGGFVDIEAAFEKQVAPYRVIIDVVGRPVAIELVYIGPLPN